MTTLARKRCASRHPGRGLWGALLLLVSLLLPLAAQAQSTDSPSPPLDSWEILDQRPADGEQCLVCRIRIHDGDIVEIRYKGRTFFVAASMLEDFEANPERHFEVLQPRGGLFDEAAMQTPATGVPTMKTGWLIFGLYVLTGLIFGAACSYAALNRGRPALGWFVAGLLVNVLALAVVLTKSRLPGALHDPPAGLTKIPATHTPRVCPGCGDTNHPSAPACSSCNHQLQPTTEAETARA